MYDNIDSFSIKCYDNNCKKKVHLLAVGYRTETAKTENCLKANCSGPHFSIDLSIIGDALYIKLCVT